MKNKQRSIKQNQYVKKVKKLGTGLAIYFNKVDRAVFDIEEGDSVDLADVYFIKNKKRGEDGDVL